MWGWLHSGTGWNPSPKSSNFHDFSWSFKCSTGLKSWLNRSAPASQFADVCKYRFWNDMISWSNGYVSWFLCFAVRVPCPNSPGVRDGLLVYLLVIRHWNESAGHPVRFHCFKQFSTQNSVVMSWSEFSEPCAPNESEPTLPTVQKDFVKNRVFPLKTWVLPSISFGILERWAQPAESHYSCRTEVFLQKGTLCWQILSQTVPAQTARLYRTAPWHQELDAIKCWHGVHVTPFCLCVWVWVWKMWSLVHDAYVRFLRSDLFYDSSSTLFALTWWRGKSPHDRPVEILRSLRWRWRCRCRMSPRKSSKGSAGKSRSERRGVAGCAKY